MAFNPVMDRLNKQDSGGAGRAAEKKLAKRLGAKQTPGSGSLDGCKGDVEFTTQHHEFLIENKTTMDQSFSIKLEVLLKLYQEALETTKVPALAFQFVNEGGHSEKRERWIAVPEAFFHECFGG